MNISIIKEKKLPDSPGVYFFLDKNKKPIYIGKATSLRDRTKSYFSKDLISTRGALLVKMIEEAKFIDFTKTDSVLEALLLEADLIKKFRPIYNTKEKDDKSFNCIVITKEDFPRILIIRKKDIDFDSLSANGNKISSVYGPYPNGSQFKEALKIIRRIFPWRDEKCKMKGKPCFNYSIGLCPGMCAGKISKTEYAKTLKYLKVIFSGNTKKLVGDLEKDMDRFAKSEEFEKASEIKNKIYALKHINDVSLIKSDYLKTNYSDLSFRIESYDIAHMSGENMVGVMTVLKDGEPDRSSYRKFNIRSVKGSNDTASLKEIISRRFNHPEWTYPELIVIDGGIAQKNAAESILNGLRITIPVVSVVKDETHKAREILGDKDLISKYNKDIILANSEAHRFAIAFHKKKRGKSFLNF